MPREEKMGKEVSDNSCFSDRHTSCLASVAQPCPCFQDLSVLAFWHFIS